MAGRYPQPPSDNETRGNLKNRKGKVDSVAKAFTGIVNVYALIKKGDGVATPPDIGVPPAPPGTILYPQSKATGVKKVAGSRVKDGLKIKLLEKENRSLKDKPESLASENYVYKYDDDTNDFKGMRLARFLHGKRMGWIKDYGIYEQQLLNNRNLINKYHIDKEKYPGDFKQITNAVREIRRFKHKDKDRSIQRQAMRMGVLAEQMEQWYQMAAFNPVKVLHTVEKHQHDVSANKEARDKLKELKNVLDINNITIQKEDIIQPKNSALSGKQGLRDGLSLSPSSQTVITVPTANQLPVPLGSGIKRVSNAEINTPGKYFELKFPSDIKESFKEDPKSVVYTADSDNNNIRYYVNLLANRKRKISKSNMKRPRLVFRIKKSTKSKMSRSQSMKKSILNTIRCKCRGRR